MGKTLSEITQQLNSTDKKVQLIYAFNGTGKTRLSRELKQQIAPKLWPATRTDRPDRLHEGCGLRCRAACRL